MFTTEKPIFISLTQPLTPEERAEYERDREERRKQEEELARQRREQAQKEMEALPARAGNNPHASHLEPWGDHFIGKLLPNEEARVGVLILPNTRTAQDRPHACEVIRVSPELDPAKFPKLHEARDRLARGEASGLFVLYQLGAGIEWTDTYTGEMHILLNPKFVIGSYDIDRARQGQ